MSEATPKIKDEVIDLERGSDGEWRILKEEAPTQAKELIATVEGYTDMSLADRFSTLVQIMIELPAVPQNRFLIEELAREAKMVELKKGIEQYSVELDRLGRNIDVSA